MTGTVVIAPRCVDGLAFACSRTVARALTGTRGGALAGTPVTAGRAAIAVVIACSLVHRVVYLA